MQGLGEVFIFDTDGRFIKKLQKGRGPGEYIYPLDITIDRKNRKLAILDYWDKILEYDLDGNFLGSKDIDVSNFHLQSTGNGYLLYNPATSKKNKALVSYAPNDGETVELLDRIYDGQGITTSGYAFTPAGKDSTLVANIFSDVIYLFDGTTEVLSPYIVFDYGPNGSANEDVSRHRDLREYREYARENNMATGPSAFSKMGNYLYFANFEAFNYGIYDLIDGRTVLYEKLFTDLPNYYGLNGKTEDRVIFAYNPVILLDYFEKDPPITEKARELASRLKEDDNPVLIFGYR